MSRTETILFLARRFLFVREVGGPNMGVWVNTIQKVTGNGDGDSWCASFVSLILGMAYDGKSPLPRSASCDAFLEAARTKGWLTQTPSVGDLYLKLKSPIDAVHIGFVTSTSPLTGISGNTSADGTSSNGDRVAEREIKADGHIFVAYSR